MPARGRGRPVSSPPCRAATDEVMADVFEVQGEGDDDLTRLFDLALVGQLVSLHLAAREGVDPGPGSRRRRGAGRRVVLVARRRAGDGCPGVQEVGLGPDATLVDPSRGYSKAQNMSWMWM